MSASGLPIVPGGLGTVDAALTYGLVRAGARTSPALAVVVLYRLISFALLGAVGWVLWLLSREGRSVAGPPVD
jgi:putative heme transporter